MRILLVGGTGFIGGHLLAALQVAGHSLVATSRSGTGPRLPGVTWQSLDLAELAKNPGALTWPADTELLINAAGVLDNDPQRLSQIQDAGTRVLFDHAAQRGVPVLQLSALGAGDHPDVPFLSSKAAADRYLLGLGIPALILRPSLVVGEGGASSQWLARLSTLPLAPLLNNQAQVQPLHITDLVGAVMALLRDWPENPQVVPLVGPEPMTMAGLVDHLRLAQGRPSGRYVPLPTPVSSLAARLGDRLGWRALNRQTLTLARRDNLGDGGHLERLCGYRVAPIASRLGSWPQQPAVVAEVLRPLMLAALVIIWLGTAFVCLGPGYDWGLRILGEAGITGPVAGLLVRGGGAFDALLGVGLLIRRWRTAALAAQLALMLGYTMIITMILPHYWLDPFAAVGKNLVLMVATLWLLWTEPSRGATRR